MGGPAKNIPIKSHNPLGVGRVLNNSRLLSRSGPRVTILEVILKRCSFKGYPCWLQSPCTLLVSSKRIRFVGL